VWSFVNKCSELDEAKRAEGTDLDEFQAHRFLEHFKETMTVQAHSLLAFSLLVFLSFPFLYSPCSV
jgi:hypothetical protein